MPKLAAMTRSELTLILSLYENRNVSTMFESRDLSKVMSNAQDFVDIYEQIPFDYRRSFIAALGVHRFDAIVGEDGWHHFFETCGGMNASPIMHHMNSLGFKFNLRSREDLQKLLSISSESRWPILASLFDNLKDLMINGNDGLPGFLRDHFVGDAELLVAQIGLRVEYHHGWANPPVFFKRLPHYTRHHLEIMNTILGSKGQTESLNDKDLASMLKKLSSSDLARLLEKHHDTTLANRPGAIKLLVEKRGTDLEVARVIMNRYFQPIHKSSPGFWKEHWQPLLIHLTDHHTAGALIATLGDNRATLGIMNHYEQLVNHIRPVLLELGAAKKLLDWLADPLIVFRTLYELFPVIRSEKPEDKTGAGLALLIFGSIAVALWLALLLVSLVLKIPISCTKYGQMHQTLMAEMQAQSIPAIDLAALVNCYDNLIPFHTDLKDRSFPSVHFSTTAESPASSSDSQTPAFS